MSEVEQGTDESVEIVLSDMIDMINLIDICSDRGTFKGEELEAVGGLRNRIRRFVDQYNPPEELFTNPQNGNENEEEIDNETN